MNTIYTQFICTQPVLISQKRALQPTPSTTPLASSILRTPQSLLDRFQCQMLHLKRKPETASPLIPRKQIQKYTSVADTFLPFSQRSL